MAGKEEKKEGKVKEGTLQKSGGAGRGAGALSPFDEMDRMFDSFFPRGWLRPMRWEWPSWAEAAAPFEGKAPRVDVIERDNEVVIKAELPGVKKGDIDVSMTDNTICIKGSTRHEEKEEKGDYYRREMSRGEFSRTLSLPAEVDGDKAKAKFADGVLEVVVPKVEKAKRRSVKVD